jgi:arylsulfatase
MFTFIPAQAIIEEFLKTFAEFPPRQKPASFSVDQALESAKEKENQLAGTTGGGPK